MAHTDEKVCLTVVAFLVRDGTVLLANHPKYGKWLPIGGHIDKGEDTDEALFREIWEEAALEKTAVQMFGQEEQPHAEYRALLHSPFYIDRHKVSDRDHVAIVYFGRVLPGHEPQMSEEHLELRWFSEEDLTESEMLPRDVIWYAKEALRVAASHA